MRKEKCCTKKWVSSDFQRQTCWVALTGLALAIILGITCGGVVVLGKVLNYLEPVLLPVFIAAILAYLLDPVVNWIEKRRVPRVWAVLIVMTALLGGIVGFVWTVIPPVISQANDLITRRTELVSKTADLADKVLATPYIVSFVDKMYARSLQDMIDAETPPAEAEKIRSETNTSKKIINYVEAHSSSYIVNGLRWLVSGTSALFGLTGLIVGLAMVPILLFYFLKESSKIATKWHVLLPLRASHFKEEVVETLQEINGYLIAFFRGQMLVSIMEGLMIAIGLKFMGMPYAFLIGLAVAVLGIVPYVGIISVAIPSLILAWFTWGDMTHVFYVGIVFLAANQFDAWVIQPRIVGELVGLHELTVMFSVLFWTVVLGGIVGALLAVPLTASLKVLFRRYIWAKVPTVVMDDGVELATVSVGERDDDR